MSATGGSGQPTAARPHANPPQQGRSARPVPRAPAPRRPRDRRGEEGIRTVGSEGGGEDREERGRTESQLPQWLSWESLRTHTRTRKRCHFWTVGQVFNLPSSRAS
jgi:hypothetical protein